MQWSERKQGDVLQLTMQVSGGPEAVLSSARHLWAVFQSRVMPAHAGVLWDEVRVDLHNSGMCWVYPASTTDAGVAARVVVGLDIPTMRDDWDAVAETYWDEDEDDFKDGHADAERACLMPYAQAMIDALPRAGWCFDDAATWRDAAGSVVCIAESDDEEEALVEHSLLASPISTVSKIGPFMTYQPIPFTPPSLPLTAERRATLEALASGRWIDELDDEVRDDPAALDRLSADKARECKRFLDTTTDPYELHCFADACSVEMGLNELRAVIEHPHCDAGTALSIYWRARPEYFLPCASAAEVQDHEQDTFALIEDIERRYLKGDYRRHQIGFDPNRRGMVGLYTEQLATAKRSLPPRMYDPVEPDPVAARR